jgi:replicative DNA helicase
MEEIRGTAEGFSDLELLSLLRTKTAFNKITPFIKEYVVTPEAVTVMRNISLFYTENPTKDELDWGTFKHFMLTTHNGHFKKPETELYATLIERLHKKEYDESIADALLEHYITKDYATKAANMADEIVRGTEEYSLDDLEDLITTYKKDVGAALTSTDLFECPTETTTASRADPGLEWRLEELNASLGPLRQGDFIILAARPETGKTSMLASEVTYMASQDKTDRPVLWIRNEERASRIGDRLRQAALGKNQIQIEMLGSKANDEYEKLVGKKKILVLKDDSGACEIRKLERIIEEMNPMLIVFDVLDKVKTSKKYDSDVAKLADIYIWARNIAIKYCPVIASSQVSGEGEGEKWITQEMLRGSKTDKAAEADAIITMGKTKEPTMVNKRFIHIAKNKLVGGMRSKEVHRHEYWEVDIIPEICRFKGDL